MTWTPERRARQAEAIRDWAPWKHSTGPRSTEGKAKSARNADRGVAATQRSMRTISRVIAAYRRQLGKVIV